MEQFFSSEESGIKKASPVTLLSLSSLVLAIINCIVYFVYYTFMFNGGEAYYKLVFKFPSVLNLLDLVVFLSPFVLFAVYLFSLYKNFNAKICVPIAFGLVALYPVLRIIVNSSLGYGFRFRFGNLLELLVAVAFILLTISTLKGFSKKAFVIVAVACGILRELFYVYNFINSIHFYMAYKWYLFLIVYPLGYIGSILFYIAILIFGLKSKMPSIITVSPEREKKNAKKMSPEQSLRMLNDKLALGMITEEEYQAQRAEIIDEL